MVWDEASIVADRVRSDLATQMTIIQSATATTGMTAGTKAWDAFKKMLKTLSGD